MIQGDSTEYEILKEACKTLDTDDLFTAEIGVRQGQGSKIILDELIFKKHWHIGIDPYGDIKYSHYDNDEKIKWNGDSTPPTYPNSMKQQLIKDLDYPNFTLYQLGDDEFMKRFEDGVPIYRDKKQIKTKYDLVHFDGPHKTYDVIKEAMFFGERSHKGTVFVFDDYPTFDMDAVLKIIVNEFGFMLLKQGKNKISLKRN
jgi:hypothetical protein|tara:strand:- start:599 stop:1198 length:600 start_codon:yes stop_codon:yes gene_type:complete